MLCIPVLSHSMIAADLRHSWMPVCGFFFNQKHTRYFLDAMNLFLSFFYGQLCHEQPVICSRHKYVHRNPLIIIWDLFSATCVGQFVPFFNFISSEMRIKRQSSPEVNSCTGLLLLYNFIQPGTGQILINFTTFCAWWLVRCWVVSMYKVFF